eukprot:1464477-Pyramimonas_sp.AAC.1
MHAVRQEILRVGRVQYRGASDRFLRGDVVFSTELELSANYGAEIHAARQELIRSASLKYRDA